MNEPTIRLQWQRVSSLIAPDGGEISDRALLDFARAHELTESQTLNLVRLRASLDFIDHGTVEKLSLAASVEPAWLLGVDASPAPHAELVGCWRLTDVQLNDADGWHDTLRRMGPEELVFGNDGQVQVYRQHEQVRHAYYMIPGKEELQLGDTLYRIMALTGDKLEVACADGAKTLKLVYSSITPGQVHRTPLPQPAPVQLNDTWRIVQCQETVDGAWTPTEEYTSRPGFWIWDIVSLNDRHQLRESRFGFRKQERWLHYDAGIIAARFGRLGWRYFYMAADVADSLWAYELDGVTGDMRDSRRRYRLVRQQPENDAFASLLGWAESHDMMIKPADRLPLELLTCCRSDRAGEMHDLLVSDELQLNPRAYAQEQYAGAFIFLHNYLIYARNAKLRKRRPIPIGEAYRQFQTIVSWWLDEQQHGNEHRYIHLFNVDKNPEVFVRLDESSQAWNRLVTVMGMLGFSANYFARDIGIMRTEELYKIKRGNAQMTGELADRICTRYPQFNREWILTGQGSICNK